MQSRLKIWKRPATVLFSVGQNCLTVSFGYNFLIFSLSIIIKGAKFPASAPLHNSVILLYEFSATTGDAHSPLVGREAITPTLSFGFSTPMYVKYRFAISKSVVTLPPPVPPPTPAQIMILSILFPNTSLYLLKISWLLSSKAFFDTEWSFPAPDAPSYTKWCLWFSGNPRWLKSDFARLNAMVFRYPRSKKALAILPPPWPAPTIP